MNADCIDDVFYTDKEEALVEIVTRKKHTKELNKLILFFVCEKKFFLSFFLYFYTRENKNVALRDNGGRIFVLIFFYIVEIFYLLTILE